MTQMEIIYFNSVRYWIFCKDGDFGEGMARGGRGRERDFVCIIHLTDS